MRHVHARTAWAHERAPTRTLRTTPPPPPPQPTDPAQDSLVAAGGVPVLLRLAAVAQAQQAAALAAPGALLVLGAKAPRGPPAMQVRPEYNLNPLTSIHWRASLVPAGGNSRSNSVYLSCCSY